MFEFFKWIAEYVSGYFGMAYFSGDGPMNDNVSLAQKAKEDVDIASSSADGPINDNVSLDQEIKVIKDAEFSKIYNNERSKAGISGAAYCEYVNSTPVFYGSAQDAYNAMIPEGFSIGRAAGGGDCFFDSFRQGLEMRVGVKVSVEQLRKDCAEHAKHSERESFEMCHMGRDLSNTKDQYIENIMVSGFWGCPFQEGSMLCKKYNVSLHAVGILPSPYKDRDYIIERNIVNHDGSVVHTSDVSDKQYNNDRNTIHIINKGFAHFEPVLDGDYLYALELQMRDDDYSYALKLQMQDDYSYALKLQMQECNAFVFDVLQKRINEGKVSAVTFNQGMFESQVEDKIIELYSSSAFHDADVTRIKEILIKTTDEALLNLEQPSSRVNSCAQECLSSTSEGFNVGAQRQACVH